MTSKLIVIPMIEAHSGFLALCTGMEILAWFLVEGKYYSHT